MSEMTALGGHVTAGSRRGWGDVAPHLRGVVSFLADAFLETAETTYRVWRHAGYTYGGQTVLDIMPGFDVLGVADMGGQAAYWWPIIHEQLLAEEARLGVRVDAIKMTNEVGGNDTAALEKLIAYERALMPLMEADGRVLVFGNFATGSPHWEIWETLCAPFVAEGWARGHVYSRHAYFDVGEAQVHVQRPFREMDYFDVPGPTVLGEIGYVTFPGTIEFMAGMSAFDELMRGYPEIGFGAAFTYGNWNQANIEAASGELGVYLRERPFEAWYPHYDPPAPPAGRHTAVVVKLPQNMTRLEWMGAADAAYGFRHTMTASHDDMLTVLRGGNAESYVKAAYPERDAEALALVEAAGFRWEPLTAVLPPPEPPPSGQLIDLRRFMQADAHCWRVVRHGDGSQEDVQDMALGGGLFVRRKNGLGEWWRVDDDYFYLIHDTSPAPGSDGMQRVYTLTKNGRPGAPKNRVTQRVGEAWQEAGTHHVQFRAAAGCMALTENSGEAQNLAAVTRYEMSYTFNRYGQHLTFDEAVWLQTGAETQIYGRIDGRAAGWIGWEAPWGASEVVEVHWDRGVMTEEPERYCSW